MTALFLLIFAVVLGIAVFHDKDSKIRRRLGPEYAAKSDEVITRWMRGEISFGEMETEFFRLEDHYARLAENPAPSEG